MGSLKIRTGRGFEIYFSTVCVFGVVTVFGEMHAFRGDGGDIGFFLEAGNI